MSEPGTPPSLDMSLVTDSSSLLSNESLLTEPSLLGTSLHGCEQPNIHMQNPRSGSRMLQGFGIEGLFEGGGKQFGGMGLLSKQFGRLGTDNMSTEGLSQTLC